MKESGRWLAIAICTLAMLMYAISGNSFAVPPPEWEAPETLTFIDLAPAIEHPSLGPFYLFTASAARRPALRNEGRSERLSGLVGVYLPRPTHDTIPAHVVYYPELAVGDIFPVFGHLYRASPFEPRGANKPSARRVTWDDVPRGMGTGANLWSVPLGGTLALQDRKLHLTAITREHRGSSAVATLDIWYRRPKQTFKLTKGSRFDVGDWQFEVWRIIPPDGEHQIIGWLELMGELRPVEDVGEGR